jgi:adenosylmethionine-8-amino-7-oxononanoate aminotransferase
MESAMKMARQYYYELSPKQTKRVTFIAREGSYHGTTLGSLSMSGHVGRRNMFHELLMNNIYRVSPANEYRGKADGQTTEQYVQQLADELDRKFEEVGPETVCAFVAEPVVGAVSFSVSAFKTRHSLIVDQTIGTVPAPEGYFKAMKKVCEKHGALLILDGMHPARHIC